MEETNFKLWGLVNVFDDPERIILAKGNIKQGHTKRYGDFFTIEEGSVFKPNGNQNWYFTDLSVAIDRFSKSDVRVPEDKWLLYYKHSGLYFPCYGSLWDVIAVRVLNDLEYIDYVYHN